MTRRSLVLTVAMVLLTRFGVAQEAPTTAPANYGRESYRLVSSPHEIVSVLESGITVIIRRVQSPVVSVRAYAHTGGVYETKWLGGGLSHLLEHLVAGGTNDRRSEAENRNLLQKIGNNSNAYTTTDHTCYFVNTTAEHADEAIDLVSGWMLGAKITPAEYAREYEVVQREVEMGLGEPDRAFWKLTQYNRYRVSPARVPVVGYKEVIQSLSRDDVYGYYQLAYQPNNLVFAVAGDIDPEKLLTAVQKFTANARPGREFSHELPPEPPVSAPRTVVATFPRLGQAKLQIGFPTVRLDDPDMYPLDVLATIMGSGESSMLVEELRDKRQLVSNVGAGDYTPHYVEGTFTIDMELDAAKVDEATKAVLEMVEQVKHAPIDAARLSRAKTQIRASRLKSMQTSEDIIGSMAMDYLSTGDPHFSDRYVDRIAEVTAAQIQAAAQKYMDRSRLLTTALLPAEAVGSAGLPKAEDLLRPIAPTTQSKEEPTARQQITRTMLDNGVILLHKKIASTPLVDVRMYSLGGLTAEDQKTNGLGSLAMEMATRGTKTRSAQQIAEFFDSIGGDLGTDCGNNSWYWTMTCMKPDLAKAMEVYADVINNPSFPDAEMAGVKQRTLAAIESQDADWQGQAMRFFRKSYFGPSNSPYQFTAIGQKEIISAATPDQLRQWYTDKVLKSRRVLAIFGDVDLSQAQSLARQYFSAGEKLAGAAQTAAAPDDVKAAEGPASINVRAVEVQKTEQPLAGVVIGFKSDSVIGQPSSFPLNVMDTMTSGYGYPTGYLHEILRGRGLVYVVHGLIMPGRSAQLPGTFLVYAGCDPRNVNEVVDTILENIARCQGTNEEMNADWFARSKLLINTGEAMDNETPAQQATTAALDELYGLGYDYHDKFAERVNAVTIDQVRAVSRAKLRDAVVTVSTPAPELVEKKTGTREYKTFPPVDLTPRGVQHDAGQ